MYHIYISCYVNANEYGSHILIKKLRKNKIIFLKLVKTFIPNINRKQILNAKFFTHK